MFRLFVLGLLIAAGLAAAPSSALAQSAPASCNCECLNEAGKSTAIGTFPTIDKCGAECFKRDETTVSSRCIEKAGVPAAQKLAAANPLKGLSIQGAIGRVITLITGIAGTLALLMFLYGGLLFLTSAGNEDKVKQAWGIFKWTSLGLVLIFSSYTIISQVFTAISTNFEGTSPGDYPDIYPLGKITPATLAGRVISYVLGMVGVLALLMFMYGGYQYFFSFGDGKKAEAGRRTIMWAAMGILAIFLSYTAVNFVLNTLTQNLSDENTECRQAKGDAFSCMDPLQGTGCVSGLCSQTPTLSCCKAK